MRKINCFLFYFLLCVFSGYSQILQANFKKLMDGTVTSIDKKLNFETVSTSFTFTIDSITDATAKSKITLKKNGDSAITQMVGLENNATQIGFELKTLLVKPGPIKFVLSPDGVKKINVTLTHDVATPQPPASTPGVNGDFDNAIKGVFGLAIKSGTFKWNKRSNVLYKGNEIHILIDENGNFYYSGLPTTAREDNIFIFHLFYVEKAGKSFKLEYNGVFNPTVQAPFGAPSSNGAAANAATGGPAIKEIDFAAIGPFTGSVGVKLIKIDGSPAVILDKSMNIATLHHVTLNAGLYGSFLRDPQNISTYVKSNGDTTLIADNPNSRSFITIMLSFYPWPRNILYPSNDWKERLNFSVGTGINKNLAENFFAGVSYDVAQGLGISAGAHYGSRHYVVGYPNFHYGTDKFSSTASINDIVKKEYNINFYVGLNLDFRLLSYIFQSPGATAPGK